MLVSRAEAQAVSSVAAGRFHTMFVKADGTLWAMGNNSGGQLGDGTTTNRSAPVAVASGVVSVAAGYNYTLFVKADGTLWATGNNDSGQLVDGTTTGRHTPVHVTSGVASVATGGRYTVFVKTDGTLWAVGNNYAGQLGDGTTTDRHSPVQVASSVASVAAGMSHTMFVTRDGTLWGMGNNSSGQLGDGSTTNRLTPEPVASGVISVSASGTHTMFVKADGTLWAMGANFYGQLGDGTTTDRLTPIQVATGVASVVADSFLTLFVKTDQTLWGTGRGYLRQLGDGTPTGPTTPVRIASDVSSVAAGTDHTMFVKSDGTLWAAGRNNYGELGYPVPSVAFPTDPVQVVPAPGITGFHVITSSGATAFTEGRNVTSMPVTVDPALIVSSGTATLVSAKISVAGSNFPPAEDMLEFANPGATTGNIAGSYDPFFGALTLFSDGGTATLMEWQAALRSITYTNTADSPSTVNRTISIVVNNGMANSAVATRTVSVTAVNDVPTDIMLSSAAIRPGSGVNAPVGTLSATDLDNTSFTYSLVSGEGSADNGFFTIVGATLCSNIPATLSRGWYAVRIQADDGNGGTYAKAFRLTVVGPGLRAAESVAAGYYSRFVTPNGTLWGVGTFDDRVPVKLTEGVTMVPQGINHGEMYLKRDGTLWISGPQNNFWVTPSEAPVPVATDVSTVAVGGDMIATTSAGAGAAGDNPIRDNLRTMFVKTDGTLWGVGGNNRGQLGDGTTTDRPTPIQIAAGVASVAAGSDFTLFVKTDSSLWGMGRNALGQLGDSTNVDRSIPEQITTGVASVSAGGGHTLFVKTDGTLWAMGAGGMLGDGTETNRNIPVQIASGVANASAGHYHTAFVKTDGTLWTVGWNSLGQLGDGTNTNRVTPVQVASGVSAASAGLSHTAFVKFDGSLWTIGPGGPNYPQYLVPTLVVPAALLAQPSSQSVKVQQTVTFTAVAAGANPPTNDRQPPVYQWQFNGTAISAVGNITPDHATIYGPTTSTLQVINVQPENAGLYSAVISGGAATSEPAIFGLTSTAKVIGAGSEIAHDIYVAANGNTIDQVLLQGPAAAITADHALNQITRMSFIDLSNDIVQVEFSGPGTLSLVLHDPTGPATAANYNQPTVAYMKGHAGIVITGATEDTNVSVFSVGRLTAVNQSLFKSDVTYDGVADLAFIAIASSNGRFGGLRAANASFFATHGLTGVYAPGVQFTGPVYVGEISASGTAGPVLMLGSATNNTWITGGDLLQLNGNPVKVSGITQLKFTAGSTSHGVADLPAQTNKAVLLQDSVDVTAQIVLAPGS